MKNRISVLATMIGLAAASSPVAAQEARRVDFGVQGKVLQDSNIARASDALAATRGITQKDTILTPTFTFDLLVPVSRQSIYLTGSAGYDFYRNNNQLNRERAKVEGGVNSQLGPCQGTLFGTFARAQSDLQDLVLLDPENVLETKSVGVELACARATGLGTSVSASQKWGDNSNTVQQQADYETKSLTGSVFYSRPSFGSLSVFVSHEETEYPNRGLLPGGSSGYELQSVGAAFERKIGSRLQGRISAALTTVDQSSNLLSGKTDKFDGPTYGASLTFRPSDRLEAILAYERKVVPSTRIGKLYDLDESVRLEGRYKFGSRITAAVGGQLRNVESEDAFPLTVPSILLSDSETRMLFGSLTFKQSQRFSFVLDVVHEDRDANLPVFEYSATRVGASVGVAF